MKLLALTTLILATLLAAAAAEATTIKFQVTSLGGNNYRYDWLVHNSSLAVDIEDFAIFFSEVTLPEATNLAVSASPSNWADQVVPESGGPTPLAGYYEAWLDSGVGIAPGDSLGGFAATCMWTGGANGPGSQYFEIYDANLQLIDVGHTIPMGGGQIPEWGSLTLFFVGLGPIGLAIRRKK